MMKNHNLAASISDAAFGEIKRQFEYKSSWAGIHLVKAPQFYASSKFCSCCGKKNNDLKLSDREWKCSSCGAEHDRDFNASQNLKFFGCWLLNIESTVSYTGIDASGDERLQFLTERCSSMKLEFGSKFI
jgi:putative transposase